MTSEGRARRRKYDNHFAWRVNKKYCMERSTRSPRSQELYIQCIIILALILRVSDPIVVLYTMFLHHANPTRSSYMPMALPQDIRSEFRTIVCV